MSVVGVNAVCVSVVCVSGGCDSTLMQKTAQKEHKVSNSSIFLSVDFLLEL